MGTSGPGSAATGQEPSGGKHATGQEPLQSSGKTGQEPQAPNSEAVDQESDPAKLRSMLAQARQEAAQNRVAAREYEEYKANAEKAAMTELQKAQKSAGEFESRYNEAIVQLQQIRVERAIEKAAIAHNIIDADAAAKLIDWSKLEFDDAGMPTNADKLLKGLAESKPYLVSQSPNGTNGGTAASPPIRSTGGGATNPSSVASREPLTYDLILQLGKDPQAYEARRPEIQRWLQTHHL